MTNISLSDNLISSNGNLGFSGTTKLSDAKNTNRLNLKDDQSLAVIINLNKPIESSFQSYNSNGAFKESKSSADIRKALQRLQENQDLYGEGISTKMRDRLRESSTKIESCASQIKDFANLSKTNKSAVNVESLINLSAELENLEGELDELLKTTANPLEIEAIKKQLDAIKALSKMIQSIFTNLVKIDDIEDLQEASARLNKMQETLIKAAIKLNNNPKTSQVVADQFKPLSESSIAAAKKIENLKEMEKLQEEFNNS